MIQALRWRVSASSSGPRPAAYCTGPAHVGAADGEATAADGPPADGNLTDQPLPIVAQRLSPKLGDRQRHDTVEADRALGQVDLPEPPITNADAATMRSGSRRLRACTR